MIKTKYILKKKSALIPFSIDFILKFLQNISEGNILMCIVRESGNGKQKRDTVQSVKSSIKYKPHVYTSTLNHNNYIILCVKFIIYFDNNHVLTINS